MQMQITHAEARSLIQFSMDQALRPLEKTLLQSHLTDCLECREFFRQIKAVEELVVPVMKRHWTLRPVPLSMADLKVHKNASWISSIFLTTRTALVSILFAIFLFTAWQFAQTRSESTGSLPAGVLPVPTPSGQSTSTRSTLSNCQEILYQVQPGDTLESLADRFSVSKAKILTINRLRTQVITSNMKLFIPVCGSTPTGTLHPSTLTTTYTPFFSPTTSTPGG